MKNMRKIIGVDLDEVLSETLNEILKYNNYLFNGIPITREDVFDFYIHHMPKYKADDAYSFWWFNSYFNFDKAHQASPVS